MQGRQILTMWSVGLVCALLAPQIVTVAAVYSLNETCDQYGTGFIADSDSCESFGYCKNGLFMGIKQCPQGYIYDTRGSFCGAPSTVSCTASAVESMCKYAPEGSILADPTNCRRFCQCTNKKPECNECPVGQIFDSNSLTCEWSSQTDFKCVADSICRLIPNGKFVGDSTHCGQYVTCSNGVATPGRCPKNTYYNKRIAHCQYENPCTEPTPAGYGPGVKNYLPSVPEACKNVQGIFPQYVADEKTCMGYYICTSAAGPGTWAKCPPGLHFNSGVCVTPYNFPCTFDRCGNIEQQFVGAVGTKCRNYLICKNETSQSETSRYTNNIGLPCPDNLYFNEFSQTCQPETPTSNNYKLCP